MNSLTPIDKSAEMEVEGNIRELVRRDNTVFRQTGSDGEMTANKLSTLLSRVSVTSTRQIDDLIGELQTLRDKLLADGSRVQSGHHGIRRAEPIGDTINEDHLRKREKTTGCSQHQWIGTMFAQSRRPPYSEDENHKRLA